MTSVCTVWIWCFTESVVRSVDGRQEVSDYPKTMRKMRCYLCEHMCFTCIRMQVWSCSVQCPASQSYLLQQEHLPSTFSIFQQTQTENKPDADKQRRICSQYWRSTLALAAWTCALLGTPWASTTKKNPRTLRNAKQPGSDGSAHQCT